MEHHAVVADIAISTSASSMMVWTLRRLFRFLENSQDVRLAKHVFDKSGPIAVVLTVLGNRQRPGDGNPDPDRRSFHTVTAGSGMLAHGTRDTAKS